MRIDLERKIEVAKLKFEPLFASFLSQEMNILVSFVVISLNLRFNDGSQRHIKTS